jgi:folate-dependent phosphoribosylglycinamide formyltransferase PurN
MRIAILCSSPYSETGCAFAAGLAQRGHTPVGALTLPSWDRATLTRKLGQWGWRDSFRYAASKLSPAAMTTKQVRNPYLKPWLHNRDGIFRSLHEVANHYRFPVVTVSEQNSPRAQAQLKRWSPDIAIFTGGNILREALLKIPRLGVINAHLALLPEIRGMSSPEWSFLCGIPVGITIHFMDSGIDTGPILLRREFADAENCASLTDLRNRMIAEGIELVYEAIAGLESGTIAPIPQLDREKDNQFFVMHERLKKIAAHRLKQTSLHGANCARQSSVPESSGARMHDE